MKTKIFILKHGYIIFWFLQTFYGLRNIFSPYKSLTYKREQSHIKDKRASQQQTSRKHFFNPLSLMSTKMPHILMQVCLSMCDLLVDIRHWQVKNKNGKKYSIETNLSPSYSYGKVVVIIIIIIITIIIIIPHFLLLLLLLFLHIDYKSIFFSQDTYIVAIVSHAPHTTLNGLIMNPWLSDGTEHPVTISSAVHYLNWVERCFRRSPEFCRSN